MREIENICDKFIKGQDITIPGVMISDINEFDSMKTMDEDKKDILCKTGPIKAYSRYWDNGSTIWKECSVILIDEMNLLYLVWDDKNRSIYQKLILLFNNFIENFIKKNVKLFSVEEEAFDNKSNLLDYESYSEFVKESYLDSFITDPITNKLQSTYKVKKVSRINICFEDEDLNSHINRYNDAIKSKIIYDYQNVYVKTISQKYNQYTALKDRIANEAKDISNKISRKFNKYKQEIYKEVLNFHRLTSFKTDYEINEDKLYMFFK